MATSNGPTARPTTTDRAPLRLRLAPGPAAANRLDGGWWPQSRDLAVELSDLADHLLTDHGEVSRAVLTRTEWESTIRRIPSGSTRIHIGWFPGNDSNEVVLVMADHTTMALLVVPPTMVEDEAHEAMLAAATSGNTHAPAELLDTVGESDPDGASHLWNDAGGSWWEPHLVAPSFRVAP